MKPTGMPIIEWFVSQMEELRELQLKARDGQQALWKLHEHIESKENMLRGKARQEGCVTALCFECVLPLLLLCGTLSLNGCSLFKEKAWMGNEILNTNSLPSLPSASESGFLPMSKMEIYDSSTSAPMNALPPQLLYKSLYNMPITWENPTNQLTAYNRVYLGPAQGSRTHTWQIALTNKFTLPNLTNGALHYFEVVTVNTNGRESTALSGRIKIDFCK